MKRRDFLASAATVGAATVFGLSGEGSQAPAQGERQGGPGAPQPPAPAGAAGVAVRHRCLPRSWRASR